MLLWRAIPRSKAPQESVLISVAHVNNTRSELPPEAMLMCQGSAVLAPPLAYAVWESWP